MPTRCRLHAVVAPVLRLASRRCLVVAALPARVAEAALGRDPEAGRDPVVGGRQGLQAGQPQARQDEAVPAGRGAVALRGPAVEIGTRRVERR